MCRSERHVCAVAPRHVDRDALSVTNVGVYSGHRLYTRASMKYIERRGDERWAAGKRNEAALRWEAHPQTRGPVKGHNREPRSGVDFEH